MKREEKLFKNTIILAIGTFVPKLASLITLPLLTGYLSSEEYGSYDLILTLVSLILPAVTLQIQAAAFRFLVEHRKSTEKKKSIITNIFVFSIPISVLALIVLYIIIPVASVFTKIVICSYFMIDMLLGTTRQISRGLSKNLDYSISAIVSSVGHIIFSGLLVVSLKLGLVGAVASIMIADFCALVFLVVKSGVLSYINVSATNKDTIIEMLKYSWPMVPNSLGLWVMRLSDRLIISAVLGVAANAVYAVANKIPSLLTTAQSTFTMAWQESASLAADDKDVGIYYSNMFKTMYNFYAGCLAVLIGITPLLFKLLIKGDYADAYFQMPILFFGVFFNCLTAYFGGIYVAFKKTMSVGLTTVAAAACNLVIDLLCINWIGIYAASISTLASYLFMFIFRLIDVQKIIRFKIDFVQVVGLLILLVVESVFCYMQTTALNIFNFILGFVLMFVLNRNMFKNLLRKVIKKH